MSKTTETTTAGGPRAAAGYADLTSAEIAALSNSFCGQVAAARSLERKGLATNVREEARGGREVAFFDLTPPGEAIHRDHFVIGLDDEAA